MSENRSTTKQKPDTTPENENTANPKPESTTKKIVIGVIIGVLVSIICTGQAPGILKNLGIISEPTPTPSHIPPVVTDVTQETGVSKSTPTPTSIPTPTPTPIPTLTTYTFSSSPLDFHETLNKPVYTGPGDYYVRAANGKAQFISSEFKYGGRDGDWLFVRCTVNNGMRYGYIYAGDYYQTIRNVPTFQFSNTSAVITRSTGIWDSLMDYNIGAVDNLYENQRVTYLCNFSIEGRKLAYVEASTASGTVRGFVDPNCISFD